MINLSAKIREEKGKKTKSLREKGEIPAVLYGPKIKPISVGVVKKEFEKVFAEAGESSLISLEVGGKDGKKYSVLIHDFSRDPINRSFTHIDFYQPILTKEVEAMVPLVFEGVSLAVKDLGGTLVKSVQEVLVKALPQNLPHDIKVSIDSLKTFGDSIAVKDLKLPEGVKVMKGADETIVNVKPQAKVEEELEKPIEEKVEDVAKVEKKEKTEDVPEESAKQAAKASPAPKAPEKK